MIRFGTILWVCSGAFGLGILVLAASRQNKQVNGWWYFLAPVLGPMFLCFVLPLWLGRWKDRGQIDRKSQD